MPQLHIKIYDSNPCKNYQTSLQVKLKPGRGENLLMHTETLYIEQIHLEHAQYTWQLGPTTT